MSCRKKMIADGVSIVPRTCSECGFGICPHYPHTPKPTPSQQIEALTAENERLKKALDQAIECGVGIIHESVVLEALSAEGAHAIEHFPADTVPELYQYIKEQKQ